VKIKLHYLHAAPDLTLHLAVRFDLPPPPLEWLLGPISWTERSTIFERNKQVPGICIGTVLDALAFHGWAVLGSGYVPPADCGLRTSDDSSM